MNRVTIAVIVGSIRRESINRKLAEALVRLAPADFSCVPVQIDNLPLYNQDDDATPADSVKKLKEILVAADGFLFVTPEYNRSIPGVLKNAIDHASRPYGESAWVGKPAGVIGTSPGSIGSAMAQQHLRNVLAYLDVPTMGQPEAFVQFREGLIDESGDVGPASREFLQNWMNAFVEWIRKFVAP